MKKIAAVILTKDEEKNIKDVIENVRNSVDEVIVIDSGSTDRTVSLAQQHGAKVLFRKWDNDFAAQRNFALQNTESKWILYLDADERLSYKLIAAIKSAVDDDQDKQYSIKRKSVAFGKEFNYGVLKPDFVPRLFRRSHVTWVNKVHEKPVCSDKLELLDGYIKHYTYTDWEQWLKKFDQYTSIWAQNAYEKGQKTNFASAGLHATFSFFQMAILKLGFLDGFMGLVMSANHFFYTLMKYLKLIELQRKGEKK